MKETVKSLVYKYVDGLVTGQKFSPMEIVSYVHLTTSGVRSPMDGTVTRFLRQRRTDKGDIKVANRAKSLYIKLDTT